MRAREREIDTQAQAILKTIAAAERAYKLDTGTYWPGSSYCEDVAQINSNLSLDLVDDGKWSYKVSSGQSIYFIEMNRTAGGYDRTWMISNDSHEGNPWPGGDVP